MTTYKAFDGIAIEIYINGELNTTHYVATFAEAHDFAKRIEKLSKSSKNEKAEIKFATCDEWGNIIDRI